MQQAQATILKRIGMMMRLSYDEDAREPLPARWIDLINYLNEKERAALSTPPPRSKPTMAH